MMRWKFNFFPAYRGTGARVTYIAGDFREVRIKLPLNWRTRNYVGTIYGGSMYGAVDPIYMVMLIKLLGRDYIVWDKAALIRFKKPGRATLYARITMDDGELETIQSLLERQPKVDRIYQLQLTDRDGASIRQRSSTILHARVTDFGRCCTDPVSHRDSWLPSRNENC
jgi:hypothetical protein